MAAPHNIPTTPHAESHRPSPKAPTEVPGQYPKKPHPMPKSKPPITTAPSCVDFTDNSDLGPPCVTATWAWDFDNDNLVDDISENPTVDFDLYGGAGVYLVTLTVTTNGGTDSITQQVTVPVVP